MSEAISAYHNVTASPEFREIERMRVMAQHDEAQALYNAERKRAISIAKIMIADGETVEKTVKYTGLTQDEVEKLIDNGGIV